MLFLAHLDEMFQQVGGQVSNLLTQYIPAEHMDLIKAKIPETFVMPSPLVLLVYSLAAISALAVLEQVKYQIGRMGKGKRLPGKSTLAMAAGMVSLLLTGATHVSSQAAGQLACARGCQATLYLIATAANHWKGTSVACSG